jgi:hypothetical protein
MPATGWRMTERLELIVRNGTVATGTSRFDAELVAAPRGRSLRPVYA